MVGTPLYILLRHILDPLDEICARIVPTLSSQYTDKSQCCVYHPDCEETELRGNDLDTDPCCVGPQYYSCANININGGSRGRDAVCKQPKLCFVMLLEIVNQHEYLPMNIEVFNQHSFT